MSLSQKQAILPPQTITWKGGRLGCVVLIEQTLLPQEERFVEIRDEAAMIDAIWRLAVRGAPAIGVAGAYGVLLGVQHEEQLAPEALLVKVRESAARVSAARPTAVNLSWGAKRVLACVEAARARGLGSPAMLAALFEEARAIEHEDAEQCRRMGEHGALLLKDGDTVLTHCNAGALATAGMGSALAPIYSALAQGKRIRVYADETRPLLQGARLTAWELQRAGVEVTLITDSMAGRVMFEKRIDLVLVGADRIARNGDVCNKIGTYSVAILAREHRLPFYVVAPLSTFDPAIPDGSHIHIEERPASEVTEGFGRRTAPEGVRVYNPAFDVTPARLVSGIITEHGLIEQPNSAKVESVLRQAGRL